MIYDLKSPLNAQKTEIDENRQRFRSRIKDKLKDEQNFIKIEEESSDSGYQPLLKPNFLKLETDEFEGYFYPVLLNDTYGLLVNCSLKSDLEAQPIDSSFNSLKEELSQYSQLHERLTIGKTQIVSGWLTEEVTDVETIAQDCYQSLVDNSGKWSSNLYGKGKFLNSHIFEIWNPLSNYLDDHLLIILFSDQESFNKAANDNYLQDWIRLFSYRHKIMWTYHQSRIIKDVLKHSYQEAHTISENLKKIFK